MSRGALLVILVICGCRPVPRQQAPLDPPSPFNDYASSQTASMSRPVVYHWRNVEYRTHVVAARLTHLTTVSELVAAPTIEPDAAILHVRGRGRGLRHCEAAAVSVDGDAFNIALERIAENGAFVEYHPSFRDLIRIATAADSAVTVCNQRIALSVFDRSAIRRFVLLALLRRPSDAATSDAMLLSGTVPPVQHSSRASALEIGTADDSAARFVQLDLTMSAGRLRIAAAPLLDSEVVITLQFANNFRPAADCPELVADAGAQRLRFPRRAASTDASERWVQFEASLEQWVRFVLPDRASLSFCGRSWNADAGSLADLRRHALIAVSLRAEGEAETSGLLVPRFEVPSEEGWRGPLLLPTPRGPAPEEPVTPATPDAGVRVL